MTKIHTDSVNIFIVGLLLIASVIFFIPQSTQAATATERLKVRTSIGQAGLLSSTVVSLPNVSCLATTTGSGVQAGNGGDGGTANSAGLVRTGSVFSVASTTNIINATIVRIGR